ARKELGSCLISLNQSEEAEYLLLKSLKAYINHDSGDFELHKKQVLDLLAESYKMQGKEGKAFLESLTIFSFRD
ncbi:MAG: hypothetical protein EA393_01990, partial [Bacteroidetes bacterium]